MIADKMTIHYSSKSVEWATPWDFFNVLNSHYNFTLDACATIENAKCLKFFSPDMDGLVQDWGGEGSQVFMNPPYGREIGKWIEKAYQESLKGANVVCLLPARVDTKWFHNYCIKGNVRLLPGRLNFSGKDPAPFPCMVVVFSNVIKTPNIQVWDWRSEIPNSVDTGKEKVD